MSVETLARPSTLQSSSSYTFATSPRPLRSNRSKYRDPNESQESPKKQLYNIMIDPRVRRGSTVPAPVSSQKEEEEKQRKEARSQRLKLSRQKLSQQQQRSPTPEPLSGRKHILCHYYTHHDHQDTHRNSN